MYLVAMKTGICRDAVRFH